LVASSTDFSVLLTRGIDLVAACRALSAEGLVGDGRTWTVANGRESCGLTENLHGHLSERPTANVVAFRRPKVCSGASKSGMLSIEKSDKIPGQLLEDQRTNTIWVARTLYAPQEWLSRRKMACLSACHTIDKINGKYSGQMGR